MTTPPWLAALAGGVAGAFAAPTAAPATAPPPLPSPSAPPPAATAGIPPNVMLIGGVALAGLVVFLLVK